MCAGYGPYRALFDVSFAVPAGGIVALLGSNGAGQVDGGPGGDRTGDQRRRGPSPWPDRTSPSCRRTASPGWAWPTCPRAGASSPASPSRRTSRWPSASGPAASCWPATWSGPTPPFPVLGERRKQMAGTLSGGQQRLLSLAKVLVVPPQILVADELSLGLAPGGDRRRLRRAAGDQPERHRAAGGGTAGGPGARAWPAGPSCSIGDRWPMQGEPAGASEAVEALMARREAAAAGDPAPTDATPS